MHDDGHRYQRQRDVWGDYTSRQEFEHLLIDRKTTWLLTAQTILFAAYGVTFRSGESAQELEVFRSVVAGSGAVVAAFGFYGIHRLVTSKERSWQDYRAFYEKSDTHTLPGPLACSALEWGVRTDNTRKSLYPDRFLPVVFIIAWSILLVSAL